MKEAVKKLIEAVEITNQQTRNFNKNRFSNLTQFNKQPLLKQLFLKNCLVEVEKDNFILVHEYFNKNIGSITIDKYKGKKSFLCFFDKFTSDGRKNEFKTFASESLDVVLTRICEEFLTEKK
jgi:hypothetical protein